MMGFGLLLPVILIAGLAYLLGWLPVRSADRDHRESTETDALEILRQRYARGEIDRDEFEHKRSVLKSS